MTTLRPLRGGCQCGRNRYIITVPQDNIRQAQVVFSTDSLHQIPLGTPLAAYIRVPLAWYHSTTHALFPDETHSSIRRVYTHPSQQDSKRQFCGFCGTPLSYWSENPFSEADFIQLTLGSLLREDIRDLEDLGLLPELEDGAEKVVDSTETSKGIALRQSFGVPWFDGLVEGTRLGNLRRNKGIRASQDGRVQVEWEIVEYDDGGKDNSDADMSTVTPGKRKLQDRDES